MKQRIFAILLFIASITLISACGIKKDMVSEPLQTPTPAVTETPAPTEEPAKAAEAETKTEEKTEEDAQAPGFEEIVVDELEPED